MVLKSISAFYPDILVYIVNHITGVSDVWHISYQGTGNKQQNSSMLRSSQVLFLPSLYLFFFSFSRFNNNWNIFLRRLILSRQKFDTDRLVPKIQYPFSFTKCNFLKKKIQRHFPTCIYKKVPTCRQTRPKLATTVHEQPKKQAQNTASVRRQLTSKYSINILN